MHPCRKLTSAWGNEDTQAIMAVLEKYQVKATFFVLGDWVDRYPESVKALHAAGHEVMNHSNTHEHFNSLSTQQIIEDVNLCNNKIEELTGIRPTLFRPPYGEYNDLVVSTVRSMGMEPIQWDVDSMDWKNLASPEISKRVTTKVQPGSIILFRNTAGNTPEALPSIIEGLLQEGYKIVPVSQLILNGDYVVDHTGKQCPVTPKQ
jgi:peptidoglycan/xylan/chitin deacetylase (PgdA/CDA1 family)